MFNHTLEAVRRDLVAHLYTMAHTIDLTFCEGAGARLIGLPEDKGVADWPAYDDFSIDPFVSESLLTSVYRYVCFGEQDRVYLDDEEDGTSLGRLHAVMLFTTQLPFDGYMQEVTDHKDVSGQERGGFVSLVQTAWARRRLDAGETLALEDLAMLANVDKRSVSNALYASGESRLNARKLAHGSYEVDTIEARRWLSRRSGFAWTVLSTAKSDLEVPARLERSAVIPFLRARLDRFFPDSRKFGAASPSLLADDPGSGQKRAASKLGWSIEHLDHVLSGSADNLREDDLPALARTLKLSPAWLMQQLYGQPASSASSALDLVDHAATAPMSPLDASEETLVATLTGAGIRNGYIDFEMRFAARFFPQDAFGTRATDDKGQPVEFVFDGRVEATDIRVKSKATASPRLRFSAWLKSKQAVEGDTVRFRKIGERRYALTFTPATK